LKLIGNRGKFRALDPRLSEVVRLMRFKQPKPDKPEPKTLILSFSISCFRAVATSQLRENTRRIQHQILRRNRQQLTRK